MLTTVYQAKLEPVNDLHQASYLKVTRDRYNDTTRVAVNMELAGGFCIHMAWTEENVREAIGAD